MTGERLRRRRRMRGLLGVVAGAALLVGAAPVLAAQGTLMAKLGDTTTASDAAAVAERTGLTLVNTHPEIGWATYEYDGNRRPPTPRCAPTRRSSASTSPPPVSRWT